VTNVLRGLVAEAIVALALEPEWTWCGGDYASWDFVNQNGLRLEVKQSAARQSWAVGNATTACSFDIAIRTGRYEGTIWVPEAGRAAHLYVFAHHPVAEETADHRDPAQWDFYVVATDHLPATKRLTLKRLQSLTEPETFEKLAEAVRRVAAPAGP
jgi:hypothetical protein